MKYMLLLSLLVALPFVGCVATEDTPHSASDPANAITPTAHKDIVDPLFESTAGAKAIALGDINGDGLIDAASISSESQPVQIHLRNAATGKFDLISIAGGGPLALMEDVGLADLNGDGKLDIAVLVNDTGLVVPQQWQEDKIAAVVILVQGPDPANAADWTQVDSMDAYALNPPCALDPPGSSTCDLFMLSGTVGATDMEVADFTNDGLADVMVICNRRTKPDNPAVKYVYLYVNPGAGLVGDQANWHKSVVTVDAPDLARLASADIDEDSDLDVVLTMPTGISFNISWLRNAANGTLWERVFLAQHQNGGNVVDVGDINGDGHVDVAAGGASLKSVQWFKSPGPQWLTPSSPQVPWEVYNLAELQSGEIDQVRLHDLNNDGSLDCFVSADGTAYDFYRGADVEQIWTGRAMFRTDPYGEIGRVGFLEVNGTGFVDVLAPIDREGVSQDQIIIFWR